MNRKNTEMEQYLKENNLTGSELSIWEFSNALIAEIEKIKRSYGISYEVIKLFEDAKMYTKVYVGHLDSQDYNLFLKAFDKFSKAALDKISKMRKDCKGGDYLDEIESEFIDCIAYVNPSREKLSQLNCDLLNVSKAIEEGKVSYFGTEVVKLIEKSSKVFKNKRDISQSEDFKKFNSRFNNFKGIIENKSTQELMGASGDDLEHISEINNKIYFLIQNAQEVDSCKLDK